jgi:hypothetical protein
MDLVLHTLVDGYGGFHFPPRDSYSVLEFGVANGNGFQLMMHCRDTCMRKFAIRQNIIGLGFDTFEGMPAPQDDDRGLFWKEGDLRGNLEELKEHLSRNFQNFELVKGLFADSLPQWQSFLKDCPPLFVSIDCDYYSSTMDVFKALLPDIAPHGCLFYFDDVSVSFYSDKTGELKAIKEVNDGYFGDHIQLVEYPLWVETRELRHYKQIYRLFNLETADNQQKDIRSSRPFKVLPRERVLSPF